MCNIFNVTLINLILAEIVSIKIGLEILKGDLKSSHALFSKCIKIKIAMFGNLL